MKTVIMLLLCPLFLLTSCGDDDLCLIGSGTTYVYELPSSPFKRVSLMGPINLSITQGDTTSVEVIAEPEMFQELDYSFKNDLLEIGFKDNIRCFESEKGVWVQITLPDIIAFYVHGTSQVVSDGDLDIETLLIDINGVGDVLLTGTVQTQNIQISGSGNISNEDLQSVNTTINVQGSANIDIAVESKLDIKVEGSASVRYEGEPTITQKVSGSLNLIQVN